MADRKEKKKAPTTPKWSSAFAWAGVQWAIAWYVTNVSLDKVVAATAGGFAAGWLTAVVLGRFARWGAGVNMMMLLGIVVGVLASSGAVMGLSYLVSWWNVFRGNAQAIIDLASVGRFVLDGAAIPAAALGLTTGLYVRASLPSRIK